MLEGKFIFNSLEADENSIFVALSTGKRDGNDFAQDAFLKGAKFLILSKKPVFEIPSTKYLIVPNTLEFITNLAKEKFLKLKASKVKTISLTGSIGKTTTKDFLIFLLQKAGNKVYGTNGNLNNHIGVPFTILNAPLDIDFLVIEMGMNSIGEIDLLNKIANTDVKIITDISCAHIGNFENGIHDIAKAKSEILNESNKNTVFITKHDLFSLEDIQLNFQGKIILVDPIKKYYVKNDKTYFDFENKEYFLNEIKTAKWLTSILYGFEVLKYFGIDIPQDISGFTSVVGRGNKLILSDGCVVIDESYNASTTSMLNALETLNMQEGKKLAIIGEMREMGKYSTEEHQKILNYLEDKNFDVILVGVEFLKCKGFEKYLFFETVENLIQNYKYAKYNFILVKSSNSVNLNLFIKHIANPKTVGM